MNRSHNNGQLRSENIGNKVSLVGWVAKKRNLGSLVFVDLRDRYGITQLVFGEELNDLASSLRNEYVIAVEGEVIERESKNKNLPTGDIEIKVAKLDIINTAETTPIIIADETDALEDTRMKYRYLDLRRPTMQQNLIVRHNIVKSIRNYLDGLDFVDVETPCLIKSTPEGARDFLVPSRVHQGEFFALPQSPQMYKQLLMIAGLERYYQIARCFRDEDLRADRQLEFTQVDVETSFLSQDQIIELAEGMLKKLMKDIKNIDVKIPFKRLSYQEAMSRYGSDKPDTRFGLELVDVNNVMSKLEFTVFQDVLANNGAIKGINIEGQAGNYSRKGIDGLTDFVKKHHAKGLAWVKVINGCLEGSIAKFFTEETTNELVDVMSAKDGDLLVFVSDLEEEIVCDSLGNLRNHLAKELNLIEPNTFDFLWVVDFPLFEYDKELDRYFAKHHPFTRPIDAHLDTFDTNPKEAIAAAYDVVLNGFELGGGSLRIYEGDLQKRMFKALGMSNEQIRNQFGFFVDAFKYGTPPHGGFALGLDRVAMLLLDKPSLRDVIAFPKAASSSDPMSEAPGAVDTAQLDELGIKLK